MAPIGKLTEVLERLVRELTAHFRYYALVRYRVVSNSVGRLNLQIVRPAFGLPSILPISMLAGTPGGSGAPTLGSIVLVSFVEGDPQLPVVTHFPGPLDPSHKPSTASLDATGIVRVGASSSLVQLGSGTDTPVSPGDYNGRLVRYGDTIATSGGPLTIVPAVPGVDAIAKVKA